MYMQYNSKLHILLVIGLVYFAVSLPFRPLNFKDLWNC